MNTYEQFKADVHKILGIISEGVNAEKNTVEEVRTREYTGVLKQHVNLFTRKVATSLEFGQALQYMLTIDKKRALDFCSSQLKLSEDEINAFSAKSIDDAAKALEEKFYSKDAAYKEDGEKRQTLLKMLSAKTVMQNEQNGKEEFINKIFDITEKSGAKDLDSQVVSQDEYFYEVDLPLDKINVHFADKEIDELISKTKDKEIIKILEDSKDIMVQGPGKNTTENGYYAEKIGNIYERRRDANLYQKIKENEKTKDLDFTFSGTILSDEVKEDKDFSAFTEEMVFKDTFKSSPFTEEQRKILNDIYNKMDEHDALNVPGESGDKSYTLMKLQNHKVKMLAALKEKNIDEYVKQAQEYRKEEKFIDSMLEEMKKISSEKVMSANMSPARNDSINGKYRKDIYGMSNFNSLGQTLTLLKNNKISVDEFLNDPVKKAKEIADKALKSAEFIHKETETFDNERYIDTVLESSFGNKNFFNRQNGFFGPEIYGIERGLTGIGNLITDKNEREKYFNGANSVTKYLFHMNDGFGKDKNFFNIDVKGMDVDQVKNKFATLFSADFTKVSFDQIAGNGQPKINYTNGKLVQPYNPKTQAKNLNDPNKQLEESLELYEKLVNGSKYNVPDDFKAAIRQGLAESMKSYDKKKMSFATKEIANDLMNYDINGLDEQTMKIFKSERKIAKFKEGNLTNERISDALQTIADLKKDYNSRGFLWKLFNPQTRAENKAIKNLVKITSEKTGMSVKEINNITKDLANGRTVSQPQETEYDASKEVQNIMESDTLAEENSRQQLTLDEIKDKMNSVQVENTAEKDANQMVKDNAIGK